MPKELNIPLLAPSQREPEGAARTEVQAGDAGEDVHLVAEVVGVGVVVVVVVVVVGGVGGGGGVEGGYGGSGKGKL